MLPHLDLNLEVETALAEELGAGSGLTTAELAQGLRHVESVLKGVRDLRRLGQLPFLDLPYHERNIEAVVERVSGLRGRYQDVVVCGFGGSALGVAALVEFSQGLFYNLKRRSFPRFHLLQTLDSQTVNAVWDLIDPHETLFIVSSRSGASLELLALCQLLTDRLRDILGVERLRDHLIVMTGEKQSTLDRWAEERGFPRFHFPPGVGGRFSVLSAPHLFPAALCGVDILSLLQGAKRMDERINSAPVGENPAALLATFFFGLARWHHRRTVVLWPYVDRLGAWGDWYRQLLAESLGKFTSVKGEKIREGLTPLIADGVATQHAELQLYLEGPQDKFFFFLTADGLLENERNQHLAQLLQASRRATEQALIEQGAPSLSIDLPELSEYCLGQLLFGCEMQIALLGGMMEINPYDQPGVETVKRYVQRRLAAKN